MVPHLHSPLLPYAVSYGIQKTPAINGSSEIPKDPFKCFKVLFGRRSLIPSTHAYNEYKVGSAGSEVIQAHKASVAKLILLDTEERSRDDDVSELVSGANDVYEGIDMSQAGKPSFNMMRSKVFIKQWLVKDKSPVLYFVGGGIKGATKDTEKSVRPKASINATKLIWGFVMKRGKPLTKSFLARSLMVPKFKWLKRRCHNHDLFLDGISDNQSNGRYVIKS
ncbi:hypothetical protein Tco_1234557 [Tanacetum coccineum]